MRPEKVSQTLSFQLRHLGDREYYRCRAAIVIDGTDAPALTPSAQFTPAKHSLSAA